MPYRPPDFGGIVNDALVIRRNGRVELDGKEIGWVANLRIDNTYLFYGRGVVGPLTSYEIQFEISVTPEKYEPDAVRDMTGQIIGYLNEDGILVPKEQKSDAD